MKVAGNEQAKVLTTSELKRLFKEGFITNRDRSLFAICLFTGCRISEALALQVTDIKSYTIIFDILPIFLAKIFPLGSQYYGYCYSDVS